ncbi:uncharacterized protein CXQ87_001201 [Candidozyma duobushaemuli]|nr:uncharacterized protein CXQ87_001201 [[Candida] duobushaemulonis]PVH18281.1 hypothetical protein CXQ87_001201 [[Candida] duobushaemulonis]
MTFRLLDVAKFFTAFVPEIEFPDEAISLDEKVIYTIGAGIIFVLAQLPTYSLVKDASQAMADPFSTLRPLFAMEQGTLLELGLLPVVLSGFIWQLAAAGKLLKVNFNYAYDRELFQTAQKVTAVFFGAVFALALLFSGYYDNVIKNYTPGGENSPYGAYVLIFLQTVGTTFFLTLISEVIDKGYGFGSGVLCFIALHAASGLVRDVAGLEMVSAAPGEAPQTYGVVTSLAKTLVTLDFGAIKTSLVGLFFRPNFPTIGSVLLVLAAALTTIYLQNFRFEIPVRSNRARGAANVYPLRLFYTGALPVLFAFSVLAAAQITLYFVSVFVAPVNPLVASIVGSYAESGKVQNGIAFYLTAPSSVVESAFSPIRAVVFSTLVVVLSVSFARTWAFSSGSSPKDIAKQFKDQSIVIAGKRDASVARELTKTVSSAATTGAVLLSAVALTGELLGSSGKTVAVVVGICSAFAVLEDFMMEFQQGGGSNSQLVNAIASYQ